MANGAVSTTRIGFGYDIHRLEAGRPLWLGGVRIVDAERGAVAHSDGDVLLHALCDALLGSMGLDDIGAHFPDTDPAYKGIASLTLLARVAALLRENGATIVNVDCTVVLERPKIGPYRSEMRAAIARELGLSVDDVSIKATTNEGLGPIGAGDGIAAYAVASVSLA
jgi:2-C-methyl-D-erythritol 2,4-cyclodiphosphate synthase